MSTLARQDRPNGKMIFLTFLVLLMLMFSAMAIPKGKFVLVVVNPMSGPAAIMDIVSRSGGRYVTGTPYDWLAVAQSDDTEFSSKLFAAGALLVLDHGLLSGCAEGKQK